MNVKNFDKDDLNIKYQNLRHYLTRSTVCNSILGSHLMLCDAVFLPLNRTPIKRRSHTTYLSTPPTYSEEQNNQTLILKSRHCKYFLGLPFFFIIIGLNNTFIESKGNFFHKFSDIQIVSTPLLGNIFVLF